MSTQQEDIAIISIYTSNNRSIKIYKANMERIEWRNSSTLIMGDFNTPPSIMDRSTTWKVSKETENSSQ